MNKLQSFSTIFLTMAFAAMITTLSKNFSSTSLFFALFFICLRFKIYLDDIKEYDKDETSREAFLLGIFFWILWIMSANLVQKPHGENEAADIRLASLTLLVAIAVATIILVRDKYKDAGSSICLPCDIINFLRNWKSHPPDLPIGDKRTLWIICNILYIIVLIIAMLRNDKWSNIFFLIGCFIVYIDASKDESLFYMIKAKPDKTTKGT